MAGKKVTIPKREFITEHERLVKVLRSHGATKEAQGQAKELKEVRRGGK